MIPKVLHRIWLGSTLPVEFELYGFQWARLHPDWKIHLWTDTNMPEMNDYYNRAETLQPNDFLRFRSDIARIELLYQYGGVYVDTDIKPLKNIDPLLDRNIFVVRSPNGHGKWVSNSVIGSIPEHPALATIMNRMPDAILKNKRIHDRTGPRFISKVVADRSDVDILDSVTFFPQSIEDRNKGLKPNLTNSYAWHLWANTR